MRLWAFIEKPFFAGLLQQVWLHLVLSELQMDFKKEEKEKMKTKERKIYVAGFGGESGYAVWMKSTGFVNRIEDADLVLGVGGADVSPQYYNQPDGGYLGCSPETDKREYADFQKAISLGKKIIGICKSSQWAAALAGGAIFQDVRHPYLHEVKTFDGRTLTINSTHHNMQDVSNLKEGRDYKMLAWAEKISPYHMNGFKENVRCEKEAEIVFYPKIKFLAIQPHPEMLFRDKKYDETIKWVQMVLDKHMESVL